MRLRVFALAALVALSTTGCKRFFSFGHAGDGGTSGAGGGLLSTLATLVGFEGEIDMAVSMGIGVPTTTPGAFAMTINMKLKGDRVRMEVSMPGMPTPSLGGATIMDAGKKKSYTLMPPTKEYMELDTLATTAPAPTMKPIVTKTGRTDKVAGYSCDVISVTQPGKRERSELCVSKGLTFLGMGMGPFSTLGNDTEYGDAFKEGFPLRLESYDASGALVMKMEATRIEKKSEPDSDFEVPAGYKKMVMPSYPPTTGPAPTGGSGGYTF